MSYLLSTLYIFNVVRINVIRIPTVVNAELKIHGDLFKRKGLCAATSETNVFLLFCFTFFYELFLKVQHLCLKNKSFFNFKHHAKFLEDHLRCGEKASTKVI